jgi:hypothetical protein
MTKAALSLLSIAGVSIGSALWFLAIVYAQALHTGPVI